MAIELTEGQLEWRPAVPVVRLRPVDGLLWRRALDVQPPPVALSQHARRKLQYNELMAAYAARVDDREWYRLVDRADPVVADAKCAAGRAAPHSGLSTRHRSALARPACCRPWAFQSFQKPLNRSGAKAVYLTVEATHHRADFPTAQRRQRSMPLALSDDQQLAIDIAAAEQEKGSDPNRER
jgi:hypothetical protein